MDTSDEFLALYSAQSVSTIHHALRSSRRRLTVILVAYQTVASVQGTSQQNNPCQEEHPHDESVTVRGVARQITSIEEGIPEEQATGEPYHNVYTSLIQTHLPRLEAVGAISYDSDRKIIRPNINLLALTIVSAASSPLVQLLFHTPIADSYSGGSGSLEDSITD